MSVIVASSNQIDVVLDAAKPSVGTCVLGLANEFRITVCTQIPSAACRREVRSISTKGRSRSTARQCHPSSLRRSCSKGELDTCSLS